MPPRRRRTNTEPSSDSSSAPPKRPRRSVTSENDRQKREKQLGGRRSMKVTAEVYRSNLKVLKALDPEQGPELKVEQFDLNRTENEAAHHTEEYSYPCMVLRRGQSFDITITFNRPYNADNDTITLQFVTGSRPKESKKTIVRIPVGKELKEDVEVWQAKVKEADEAVVTISVVAAAEEGIVGKYSVFVDTVATDGSEKHQYRYELDDHIVVLFNPWCKGDDVYMESEEDKNEYVLNEQGRLWQGTVKSNEGRPWNLGQFEEVCLDAALYLMDKAELYDGARSNPVLVVRCISAMANSDDDGGALVGRWTDTYPKSSTEPWAWTGSVAILEEFMKKKKSVEFGQCWVFSGVVTTLLRALGIPTRSVTNFESAHDTDASTTIDVHWNEEGDPLDDLNDDSIWNFHVWNEVWFRRTDLPEGYDGWQAIDATPQEASEGVMRCGPASLQAIKEGNIYLPYDAPFVFAEVNGDRIHWEVKEDGTSELLAKETDSVGCRISTKSVGSNRRNDVTSDYKHPEGSEEERRAVRRAHRYSRHPKENAFDIPEPDVTFKLETPDTVKIGDDFVLKVLMTNTVEEERNVSVRVTTKMSYYTGVTAEQIKAETLKVTLAANEEVTKEVHVAHDDYDDYLKPESMIQAYLRGTVIETKRSYAHIESFALTKPSIKIEVPERVEIKESFDMTVSYTNPMKVKLTGAQFRVDAPRIVSSLVIPHKKAIAVGETVSETVSLTARRSGSREIVVTFSSDQLTGVVGTAEVYVTYSS